jgi:hypothetical protein
MKKYWMDLNASISAFLDGIGHCRAWWIHHGDYADESKSFHREIWFIGVEGK